MLEQLTACLAQMVKQEVRTFLGQAKLADLASADWMEQQARDINEAAAKAIFDAWTDVLETVAKELGLACPLCGRSRKCKRRLNEPMKVQLLGIDVTVAKLYLQCGHCPAPGLSVTKMLTGLSDGDASTELKLMVAYSAAEHTYGKTSRDHQAHHGQQVQRTAARRIALEVEQMAMEFAQQQRAEATQRVSGEAKTLGVAQLMMQGDGGSVRTGELVLCQEGDEGFGKKTPKTGKPRRKRPAQNREVITLDVRKPGELQPQGLDVVVPCEAAAGQRAERMLALAARCGLGDNTQMLGLGDLGSKLPESFDEAFVGFDATYSADCKHVRDYVQNAAAVLNPPCPTSDTENWGDEMRSALWRRDRPRCDELLREANRRKTEQLLTDMQRCPVDALRTYLSNNCNRMNAAQFKAMDVDYVSARAEAQVRERTKKRFSVPGAWRQENLEGKAALRAIIDEGNWEPFKSWCRQRSTDLFASQLIDRITRAIADGRLANVQPAVMMSNAEPALQAAA